MALTALYYGIKTGSEAIKLDGYYSFAGLILAIISLWVVKLVAKPETIKYNFGYAIIEPLFNLVKGIMILVVVLSSSINAINSILNGGNTPSFGESIIYFFISTITCLLLTLLFYNNNNNNNNPSPIIHVEYKNWFIDTIISTSIGVAFIVSYFLQSTSYVSWIRYTDPIITLAIVIFIIRLPLTTIKTGIKEIMLSVPDDEIVERIDTIIKNVITEYDIADYNFKATKTGRELYLLIHFQITNEKDTLYSLKTQDKVREKIKLKLDNMSAIIKLDIIFSENEILYKF